MESVITNQRSRLFVDPFLFFFEIIVNEKQRGNYDQIKTYIDNFYFVVILVATYLIMGLE